MHLALCDIGANNIHYFQSQQGTLRLASNLTMCPSLVLSNLVTLVLLTEC